MTSKYDEIAQHLNILHHLPPDRIWTVIRDIPPDEMRDYEIYFYAEDIAIMSERTVSMTGAIVWIEKLAERVALDAHAIRDHLFKFSGVTTVIKTSIVGGTEVTDEMGMKSRRYVIKITFNYDEAMP
jgi:hypothetical protein